jgi:hypothetical protein
MPQQKTLEGLVAFYRSLGLALFPCDGKRPARCKTWPNAEPFRDGDNIALVVPVSCVVIDLDRKADRDGVKYLAGIAPEGWHYVGPRGATGGGGLHLWFRVSPLLAIGNGRGDLPTGIDVRGGGKGYVIVPPSIHPETGAEYEWLSPLVPVAELPPLPDWLLVHLLASPRAAAPVSSTATARNLEPYLQAVLDGETARVRDAPDGTGNETVNLAAFKLGSYAAQGLRYDDARAAVAAGLSGWSWRSVRDESAAWRTFDSGWRGGESHPRDIPESTAARSSGKKGSPPVRPPAAAAERPSVQLGADEQRVNDQVIALLGSSALYQQSGRLTRLIRAASKE